jgi:hypothetical protein
MLRKTEEIVITAALTEMFKRVGRKYSPEAISKPEWFYKSTWTSQQQEEFRQWLAKLIIRRLSYPAKKAGREAGWFIFNYGWRVVEQRIAQAPEPVGKRKERSGAAPHNPEIKK